MKIRPSFPGQSGVAATPGVGKVHGGVEVDVDDVADELIVEVDDSNPVELDQSSEEVDVSVEVEAEDSSEIEVERSLEVVAVICSSSRMSPFNVDVVGSVVLG